MGRLLKKPALQYGAMGTGLLVLLLVLVNWWGIFTPRQMSAAELHEQTLGDGPDSKRIESAVALSRHEGASTEMLHEVIEKSDLPAAQAAAIAGLGKRRDFESLPILIDKMDSPSVLVRGRAGVAVERIVGLGMGYVASDPPEERQKAIDRYQQFWDDCQKPGSKYVEFMNDPAAIEASARKASRVREQAGW